MRARLAAAAAAVLATLCSAASGAPSLSVVVTNSSGALVANVSNVPFIGGCAAGGGMTAWQATLLAGAAAPVAINVQWQVFSGAVTGVYVTAIDGEAADKTRYWALSLNGAAASVGADELAVAAGDVVGWALVAGGSGAPRR